MANETPPREKGRGGADFLGDTIRKLSERVNGVCSNPGCEMSTKAPATGDRVNNIGKASHICAAAPQGPRFDSSQMDEQRRSFDNGIWLCGACASMIDNDPAHYTVELLRDWKAQAEQRAASKLGVQPRTVATAGASVASQEQQVEDLLAKFDTADSDDRHRTALFERVPASAEEQQRVACCYVRVGAASLKRSLDAAAEERLSEVIEGEFELPSRASVLDRALHGVRLQERPDDLRFHRAWSWFECGLFEFGTSIGDLYNPGHYSLADLAVDVVRALRTAGRLVSPTDNAIVRMELQTHNLSLRLRSADRSARCHLAGVDHILHPVAERTRRPCTFSERCSASLLSGDPGAVAARFVSAALRDLHGARVHTAILRESLGRVLADERERAHR